MSIRLSGPVEPPANWTRAGIRTMNVYEETRLTRSCTNTVCATTMGATVHRESVWFQRCCRSCCCWQPLLGVICSRTTITPSQTRKWHLYRLLQFSPSPKFTVRVQNRVSGKQKKRWASGLPLDFLDKRPIATSMPVYKHTHASSSWLEAIIDIDLQFLIGKF